MAERAPHRLLSELVELNLLLTRIEALLGIELLRPSQQGFLFGPNGESQCVCD